MANYSEQLKDPRWQKKRLEILNRDNFTCQVCGSGLDGGKPLNVHHLSYKANLLPWEYPESLLITLCEECHHKIHEGIINIPDIRKSTKSNKKEQKSKKILSADKVVLYRDFLNNRKDFTPNELIVYSTLIRDAVYAVGWNENLHTYDENTVKNAIQENVNNGLGEVLKCPSINISKLSRRTGMVRNTIKSILGSLRNKQLLCSDTICVPIEVLDKGYIDMPVETKLNGQQLIIYGFLLNKGTKYNNTVDTWTYKIAEMTGISIDNVYNIFFVLHQKGYIERMKDGKLKLLKTL